MSTTLWKPASTIIAAAAVEGAKRLLAAGHERMLDVRVRLVPRSFLRCVDAAAAQIQDERRRIEHDCRNLVMAVAQHGDHGEHEPPQRGEEAHHVEREAPARALTGDEEARHHRPDGSGQVHLGGVQHDGVLHELGRHQVRTEKGRVAGELAGDLEAPVLVAHVEPVARLDLERRDAGAARLVAAFRRSLRRHGARWDTAAAHDGRTRVLAVSSVQYGNGLRMDLERLGAACRARGVVSRVGCSAQ